MTSEKDLQQARRNGTQLAAMFVDLDGFKPINDHFGHRAGDLLLKEVADRLKACVRDSDTVGRIGGDEFTIILSDLRQPDDAIAVAQKLLETVQLPITFGSVPVRVTASVVEDAAVAGDAYAVALWDEVSRLLGTAIANLVTLLNPARLILGGGVILGAPHLAELTLRRFEENVSRSATRGLSVERAWLGDDAGVIGAAVLE